jgi:hypothetical protein
MYQIQSPITALVAVFIIAYAAIALEHPLKINKSGSALVGAGLLWTIYALSAGDAHLVSEQLGESLMGTAQIVFFLMGAMTIVEVVDAHNGFEVITTRIKTTKLSTLMWLVGFVTFFLSSILDNLTTTIVMISLMRKLLAKHDDRLFFAGIIVIAAHWRRDDHHAVDWWANHQPGHHQGGFVAIAGQLAGATGYRVLCFARKGCCSACASESRGWTAHHPV